MLSVTECRQEYLFHPTMASGPIPTAHDPDGVYPYESWCESSRRPEIRSLRFVVLENDFLAAAICPDLGGKVYSLHDKRSGKEVLYAPRVIRPVRYLPRGGYIPGGIELSFPISHTPVQCEPVACQTRQAPGRVYCWCGEREIRFGMQWTVEFSLGADDNFLTQRTVLRNGTAVARPWMSWSNAGLLCDAHTEIAFPNGPVLYHGAEMKTIDWATEGPHRQGAIDRMAGFFWREPDCHAFGAFNHTQGFGLYHIADPAVTPGIKFWTYGDGPHRVFAFHCSPAGEEYLEIQGGPLIDQSIKEHLQPGQVRHHIEFWRPSGEPLAIRELHPPSVGLCDLDQVPLFDWARPAQVGVWLDLLKAYGQGKAGDRIPAPPGLDDNRWAPSGMEKLGEALDWAAEADPQNRPAWLFQLGAWHAGRDELAPACTALRESEDDRAKALLGRLLRRSEKDPRRAVEAYRSIRNPAVALHPQVTVERDLALALLGEETLEEREAWLRQTAALEDEWLRERWAALRLDQDRPLEAEEILKATRFQLIHQRYARTRLWRRIQQRLGRPDDEVPAWLGEDDLAEFGAYREYEEDVEAGAGACRPQPHPVEDAT